MIDAAHVVESGGIDRAHHLAVHGLKDIHITLEQIHGMARRVPQTGLFALNNSGHSPHRDQADRLNTAASDFNQQHTGDRQ